MPIVAIYSALAAAACITLLSRHFDTALFRPNHISPPHGSLKLYSSVGLCACQFKDALPDRK